MERWELGNDVLEFDEETHTYWVNGTKCPSVTQILKFAFPKKYEGIDEAVLKQAAERGTYVHECIEMYEQYGFDSSEVQEFRDYLFLKEKFKFKVTGNELPIIIRYKNLTICGRMDLTLEEGEQQGLGDIKSTATFDKTYLAYQLNLYRLGAMQTYGMHVEFLRGLHLRKGARKYATIPINEQAVNELLESYISVTYGTVIPQ